MTIESLQLDHFRNYASLDLDLSEGTNVFYGDNAQGKTNVLEAVFLCGTSRSHRTTKDKEMIGFGSEQSHIRMTMRKGQIPYRIDMHLKNNRAKGIAINGMAIRKTSELIGLCHFVFFSPEDLTLIKAGPSERRRFMDMELSQLHRVYVNSLSGYNKALAQRNQLLKNISFYLDSPLMLDVWDEQLISYGKSIIQERESFIQRLQPIVKDIHAKLTGEKEKLEIFYRSSTTKEEFGDHLLAGRSRDIQFKTTSVGPHRDDLGMMCNGKDVRRYGSQGQQRTCALSLKLAEIELARQTTQDEPVLLLDDVLSELDRSRQQFLLESIEQVQTLITCTGVDDFVKNEFHIDRLFHVSNGTIKSEVKSVMEDENG